MVGDLKACKTKLQGKIKRFISDLENDVEEDIPQEEILKLVEIEIQKQIDAGTLKRVKAKKVKKDSELTIQEFIPKFLHSQNIFTRDSLDKWCEMNGAKTWGDGFCRAPLYSLAEKKSPTQYAKLKHPDADVRATYEMYLEGYKIKSKDL